MWITNGPLADTDRLRKTDPAPARAASAPFLIERGMKAFRPAPSSTSRDARLRYVRTGSLRSAKSRGNLVGALGRRQCADDGAGLRRARAGPAVGIMQARWTFVLPIIHQRRQFRRADRLVPARAGKLADMYVTMNAARAYVYASQGLRSQGDDARGFAGAILLCRERATKSRSTQCNCWRQRLCQRLPDRAPAARRQA